jgi:hypothetical protein
MWGGKRRGAKNYIKCRIKKKLFISKLGTDFIINPLIA